jgi:hypothetical protein
MKWIKNDLPENLSRFEKTQRLVRWHYQWIIVREFLPLIVGAEMVCDILINDPQLYTAYPVVPSEFSVAAYRFGHSQVHYIYRINDDFQLPLFSRKPPSMERQDLQGGSIKKEYAVNWKNFFKSAEFATPGWNPQSKKIDTKLSSPLLFPPSSVARNRPEEEEELATTSLSVRDLQRGQKRGLPPGQEFAKKMESKGIKVAVLDHEALEKDNLPPELQKEIPLWYYILKEAEVQHGGKMLGDVGGRIVAEVIIGLLQEDPESLFYKGQEKGDVAYLVSLLREDFREDFPTGFPKKWDDKLKVKRGSWQPVLMIQRDGKIKEGGDFKTLDLLRYAGVPTE